MFGGENVGTAYVRIVAEGEGLDNSIRDMFSDDDFDDAGRRNSEAYSKAWAKEMHSRPNQARFRKSITDALAKGDFLRQDFFRSKNWTNFRSGLEKEFGKAGRLAGDNLERQMLEGMDFSDLKKRLDNITPEIARANRQLFAEQKKMAAETVKNNEDVAKRLRAAFESVSDEIDRLSKGQRTALSRGELSKSLRDLQGWMHSAGIESHEFSSRWTDLDKTLRRSHPTIDRTRNLISRAADAIGGAFGRGSRNDFANAIGSIVRGIVNVGQIIPALIGKVLALGDSFRVAFSESMKNSGSTFRAGMAGIIAALETGGGAFIAFGAAAAAGVLFIGPIIGLMASLAGIVIALAGSLSFALVGALGAVAGAMLPLAAGIGVVVAAFTTMDKAQKKVLKADFKPVLNSLKGLGRAAAEPIFAGLRRDAERLAPVLDNFRPLFARVGQAIANVGNYFTKALQSQGMRQFTDEMTQFLPGAVEKLGKAFGNFVGGLGGLFRGLAPITGDFLTWLEKVTGDFAKWANSAKGQNSIKNFFERAGDSIKSVGGFLKAAGRLLGLLLDKGKGAGDNIFDDMARGIRNFTQYLKDNPGAVKKFFEDAQDLAEDIGGIIKAVGKLVDALDTASTRAQGSFIVKGLGGALTAVLAPVLGLQAGIAGIGRAFGKLKDVFSGVDFGAYFRKMGSAINPFSGIGAKAAEAKAKLQTFLRWIGGISVKNPLRGLNLTQPFVGISGRVAKYLVGVSPAIRRAFTGAPGFARTAARALGNAFSSVPGRIRSFLSSVPGRVQGIFNRLPGPVRSVAGRVGSAFSGVTGRIRGLLSGIPGMVSGLMGRLPAPARRAASGVASAFSGIAGRVSGFFSSIPGRVSAILSGLGGRARAAASAVVGAFSGLAGRIIGAVGTIHLPTPTISMPHIPRIHIPGTAIGGVFNGAPGVGVIRQIAEAGPEAVVPLNRPLSQVDPAVRALSAFAQGKLPGMASGGVVGSGKTINADITVMSYASDPKAVASETVNKFATSGYF